MPRSSRASAVFAAAAVALTGDGHTTGSRDAVVLTSGDNGQMDVRQLAAGAALGMASLAELAARVVGGSAVRAGVASVPAPRSGVTGSTLAHTAPSASTALLMAAFCLLATVPAALLRPVPAAAAVWVGAVLSLLLFDFVTIAGAAALVLVAWRLARARSALPAVLLMAPFLATALAVAASGWPAAASTRGLAGTVGETRVLAVLLAAAIPVAALAGMARRAGEESRTHDAVRQLTEGVLAEHLARGERARIARELHDVVAHHISMIAVQAETARLTTPGLTDAGAHRFAAIGDTARAGLTEMRRLLGVLREDSREVAADHEVADGEPSRPRAAGRHPQPGLPQLAGLVDEARQASGCAARFIVSGPVARMDPGVELAAYRIVQEALTNARRHAPGSAVDVELRYAGDALLLRVRDNGPGDQRGAAMTGPFGGHGLLGMRERAVAVGGSLRAGNAPGGGFRVEAELPAKVPNVMTGAA